ncbi:uncharacterized protein BKA78DRAFT_356252 [Phyllosticta capitalensis]|uniref:uncharacterized protein n=1 Tax=Phyllosticta capitalensis TaxID=121624 RepID=UPI003131BB4D
MASAMHASKGWFVLSWSFLSRHEMIVFLKMMMVAMAILLFALVYPRPIVIQQQQQQQQPQHPGQRPSNQEVANQISEGRAHDGLTTANANGSESALSI